MQNELRIPFESLLNRGIQREFVHPDNNNGFLNNTYTQAFTLIKVICETSKRMTEAEKDGKSRQDEIHNVIAFTGRRGTGKTSAMLSIADSLSELSAEKGNRFEISDTFVQLPYINAAVLDEEEDIFLIVLSRMFKELDIFSSGADRMLKKDFHDRARKLKEEMCKIHGHYVNLKSNSDLTSSYYSMENLHAKYNIREEYAKLVKNYTEFYKNHETNNTTHLILCIDDVDMSRQDHMRIMQCIHQYFMIPNVVVMVTLNFPILTASLQQNTFRRLNTISDKESQNLHLAFEHTHDFLRKIIPSDMRITLPSWRKYDYRNLTPVKVNLGNADNLDALKKKFPHLKDSVLFKKLSEHKDEDYTLSPKELVLLMLADRTKVYLDVMGNKHHFMEPDSLRNLYDIFYMLYHMKSVSSKVMYEDDMSVYYRNMEANRKILLDYLYFKLKPENDFSAEEHIIREFLAEPIERRGKRIWDYYYMCLTSAIEKRRIENIYGSEFYQKQKEKFKIENYSFGELFRVLYSASRLGIMKRNFVIFVLASFSFSLPQFVEQEKVRNSRKEVNPNPRENGHKNLRDVFGYTLLGTWCEDMFAGKRTAIRIDMTELKKYETFGDTPSVREEFDNFIDDLLSLLLMSSRSTRNPFNTVISKKDENAEECGQYFYINNDVDPTAFIMNSLRIQERLEKMQFDISCLNILDEKICKSGVNESKNINGKDIKIYPISKLLYHLFKHEEISVDEDELYTIVSDRVKSLIGGESFYNTTHNSPNTLWFFLKHTDLAYNVIKRAASYIIYSSDTNLKDMKANRRTPLETIQKFYEIVYDKLKEEDDLYFINGKDSEECKFSELFKDHKMVKMFCSECLDKKERQYPTEDEVFKYGCSIGFSDDERETKIYNDKTTGEQPK